MYINSLLLISKYIDISIIIIFAISLFSSNILAQENEVTDNIPTELSGLMELENFNQESNVSQKPFQKSIALTFELHSLTTASIGTNKDSFWRTNSYIEKIYPMQQLSQLLEISNRTKTSPIEDLNIYLEGRIRWQPDNSENPKPEILIDQAYSQIDWTENLVMKLGILRPGWGAGFAFNPTDTFSPAVDPLDPGRYSPGVTTLQFQTIFENFSLTALTVFKYSLFNDTESPTWKNLRFGLQGALSLGEQGNTDLFVNAAWNETGPLTLGTTIRSDLKIFVIHVEAVASYEEKSVQYYPLSRQEIEQPDIFNSSYKIIGMIPSLKKWKAQVDAGISRILGDYGFLVLEYYYNGKGYTPDEFQRYIRLFKRVSEEPNASRLSEDYQGLINQYQVGDLGQHFIFLQISYGFLGGDILISLNYLINVLDSSQYYYPSIVYKGLQNFTFSLEGVATVDFVKKQTEFGSSPFVGGLMLRMQSFF